MSGLVRQLGNSGDLRRRALARTPGGVHSNVRLSGPEAFVKRAQGAWIHSVDGVDYVDYMLGQGASFLGHAPEVVVDAAFASAANGLICGGQHEYEVRAAEAVCEAVGWADMVRFGMTGTESVQAALRLARAVTGRTKVVRFEGHYHGWLDNVLMAEDKGCWGPASNGQLESHFADFITLPWNDTDVITDVFRREGERIAAVIMEPIMINNGVIEPRTGYLEWVRRQCCRHGVVLIFDEIISGFRIALGGAAARFGVTPDLATYGKAMGGGFPVAALAGRADLMHRLGTGEVNHAGTFNGWIPSMAAVVATLSQLRDSAPYVAISEHGSQLMAGIRELGAAHGLPLRVAGLPMAFHVSFGEAEVTDYRSLQRLDLARYRELAAALVDHGIWVAKRGVWYVSAAHGPADLDAALTRFKATLNDWLK